MIDPSKLMLQFADDFKEVGPFDPKKWTKLEHADLDIWPSDEELAAGYKWQEWQKAAIPKLRAKRAIRQAEARAEGGYAVVKATTTMPAGPAVFAYAGFYTRERQFSPGLSGTNVFEITLADYTPGGEFLNKYLDAYGAPSDVEDPVSGRYIMGACLMIGSFPGLILGKEDAVKDRAVQFGFDWWSKYGFSPWIARNIIPGDEEKYPQWDPKKQPMDAMSKPFIARPCLVLAHRKNPTGEGGSPVGHRYGLGLTDDGNTAFWTLDGRVMDVVNITGHFQSSPDSVKQGACGSVCMAGSYQSNVWKFTSAKIYVPQSPPD